MLTIKLMVYFHCAACLQLWVIQYEALWDSPIYSKDPLWAGKFYHDSTEHMYLVCLTQAMLINRGKNVQPATSLQAFLDVALMLLGIAVYGHVLGVFKEVKFEMAEISILF